MSRPGELFLDLVLLGLVGILALRFSPVLLVVGTFLALTVALMVFERAVR